jgi:hypothetical protein
LVTGCRTRGGRRAKDWDKVRGDVGAHAGYGATRVEVVGVEAKTRASSRGAETDELGCMSGRESLRGRRGARELLSKMRQVAGTDKKRRHL